ncbi:hypothetical protein FDP41_002421 [Naegleria fowleri]|uniref:U2A'/phosphoprotein 32 family A C-terminal domain-containing protein n=1 Tax=Naegleria fowleri TaxID=5763 RepID=A0A6A5BVY4_NAEFO|nr:uncharacterized protein FDP41_002421 [Naegleria fowleri]KAF0978601.1 hypothetical protein FDP41_002421 [Naegleria fowleri]CAG4715905.1 unnamed protein product [Naegleria fowleri]
MSATDNTVTTSDDVLDGCQLTNHGKHLSVVSKDLSIIPSSIFSRFGVGIESLDFSFNNLKRVENLNRFTNLKSLVLDNNLIEDIRHFPSFSNLETLWLNNNNIYDLDATIEACLQKFPKLIYLSLLKNPACPNEFTGNDTDDYQHYRLYVLYRMNNLKFLDSRQVTEEERKEAARRGKFCKVVTPDYTQQQPTNEVTEENDSDAPKMDLLAAKDYYDKEKTHSYFGYTRHVYTGKHSEGNRFIRNNDL